MYFDNCGSLRAPVPGLIFYLGVYVELVQEGLDVTLVLEDQTSSFEVLNEGQLHVSVKLNLCLSASFSV